MGQGRLSPVGVIAIVGMVLIAAAGMLGFFGSGGGGATANGAHAQSFQAKQLDGGTIDPSAQSGKVVIVDFWATWCGPCRMTIPVLENLHQQYKDKGLMIVGVTDEEPATVKPFVAANNMTYIVAADPSHQNAMQAYGVTGLPTLYVLDKKGNIRLSEVGFGPDTEKDLREIVEKLLAESS